MTLQPSEFLKPGFAVLASAVLADKAKMALPKEARHVPAARPGIGRPDPAARCRSDGAAARTLGRAALFQRLVAAVDRDDGRRLRRSRCAGLFQHQPCAPSRRTVPVPRQVRLPDRPGTEGLCPWRLDRRRSRRGDSEVSYPRRAFGLHLCRRRRRIRLRALRTDRCALLRAERAAAAALRAPPRSLFAALRVRASPPSWRCRPSSIWAWP